MAPAYLRIKFKCEEFLDERDVAIREELLQRIIGSSYPEYYITPLLAREKRVGKRLYTHKKRREYAGKTQGIRREYALKTYRLKRRFFMNV